MRFIIDSDETFTEEEMRSANEHDPDVLEALDRLVAGVSTSEQIGIGGGFTTITVTP